MAHNFIAQDKARCAALLVIQGTVGVPSRLASLSDQALRAATSVPLNIAEARGRNGKDRSYHFRIAYGSAREAEVALALLLAARTGRSEPLTMARALFDEVRAMLWPLLRAG